MDTFTSLVDKFANSLYNLLPTSPFRPYINKLASLNFLPYLNWFVPVGTLGNSDRLDICNRLVLSLSAPAPLGKND